MRKVLAFSSGLKVCLTNSWPSASPIWLSTRETQRCQRGAEHHVGSVAQRHLRGLEPSVLRGTDQTSSQRLYVGVAEYQGHRPADVGQRQVHLALGVVEYSQSGELVGQPAGIIFGVVNGHTQQH